MMNVQIYERNLSSGSQLLKFGLTYQVNSMEWGVKGGARAASITAMGGDMELWELLNLLRCPVGITDERGALAWWGYINEVQVRIGRIEVRASLTEMANRVAVAYSFVTPGTTDVGERKTTSWAEDADSIAEFGYKEWLSSQSGMTDAAAEARRDAIVAARKYPQAITTGGMVPRGRTGYSGAEESHSATIYCNGWWSTLGWRYAAVASGTVETTTQILSLVTSFGQFISAGYCDTASGVTSSAYRDGDTSALDEIEALMAVGGANGRDLTAKIDAQRRVFFAEEEASSSAALWMGKDGRVTNAVGVALLDYGELCGRWIRLRDVIPAVVDVTKMINPGLQFIEGVRWQDGSVNLEYRGQPSIEDMVITV